MGRSFSETPVAGRSAGATTGTAEGGLARRLGRFDAAMIVMGGIIGSGIFMTPSVVARQLHTPALMLSAWAAGGLIALTGAFIYAELAARRPLVGGQYAYLREAYHPLAAFLYGWTLLLVVQTGGMAAGAITFARYFLATTGATIPAWMVAALILAALTVVNALGVRAGSSVQNGFMVLKIAALLMLIACGLLLAPRAVPGMSGAAAGTHPNGAGLGEATLSMGLVTAFGAAMVPVMFSYGGWQTASFVAGEMREPSRDLPRGLMLGVGAVIVLYLAVDFVCIRALGTSALAATATPASGVMNAALGTTGGRLIAAGIALSTLGFLSQSMLTAPRVYYAMAADGLFVRAVASVHPRSRAPVVAIALQGVTAMVIAASGSFEQILSYMIGVDWIFFGLTAGCVFVLRRRDRRAGAAGARVPGHPITTGLFILMSALIVLSTIVKHPTNSAIGLAILIAGLPAYFMWRGGRGARGPVTGGAP